jgi:hypothetical protein
MRRITSALILATGLVAARDAAAICREVHEAGTPPPVIEPVQAVLVARRTGVVVGETCPEPAPDVDAGVVVDAGVPPSDAGCDPVYGDVTSMVVQPRFRIGDDGASFALLMVTPAPPVIALEDSALFSQLATFTAPTVVVEQVEVEDEALGYQCYDPHYGGSYGGGSSGGCGMGGGYYASDDDDGYSYGDAGYTPPGDGGVALETIGAYEIVRVSSTDRASLAGWLDTYGYVYTSADLDAVEPYLTAGWTVIAVRVSTDHAHDGGLEPLSFTWPGNELRLPLGISRQPSDFHYELTVYVEADGRYELGGGQVSYARRTQGPGGAGTSFLTRLELDVDPWREAADDPIAVRVDGDVEHEEYVYVTQEVHIPSSDCPPRADPGDRGCCDTGSRQQLPGFLLLIPALAFGLRRRR